MARAGGDSRERASWAWWGVAAGTFGLVANVALDDQRSLTDEERRAGAAAVIAELDRTTYHLGVVAGLLAVVCLLLLSSGWRRFADRTGQDDLAALTVAPAVLASGAVLLVAYGLRGGLAEYLPGGINDDNFTDDGL